MKLKSKNNTAENCFQRKLYYKSYRFPGISRTCINFPGLSSPKKCQNKIPGLSRTCINVPGLSSPEKCQNKIPGLSRISRIRTNPEFVTRHDATKRTVSRIPVSTFHIKKTQFHYWWEVLTTSIGVNSFAHHPFYQHCVWSLQEHYNITITGCQLILFSVVCYSSKWPTDCGFLTCMALIQRLSALSMNCRDVKC